MANSNSPWGRKSGGGNTGGSGNGLGPKSPKDNNPFEKIVRDAQQRMKNGMPNHQDNPGQAIALVAGGIFLLWLATGMYLVNSDEAGIVQRFGAYHRTATPGLNYHLPYPIEQATIVSVTTVNRVELGGRGGAVENPSVRRSKILNVAQESSAVRSEGSMLTGDRNIVDIDFEVQWKIDAAHPEKYLFNMRNTEDNVKPVAESAMREVIGRNTLDDVLTGAQSQIAEDTKQLMQQMFDEYDAGIEIIAVNLSRPDVPQPVIGEFQDVKRAEQDKQTAESVAEGYRNDIIPRAKGDGAKMIEDAEAYKSRVIADAQGDASRFKQVYGEYAQAKDVTKRRIYLETMEAVFKNMPKTVVDSAKGGVIPILPTVIPANRGAIAVDAGSAQSAAPAAPTLTAR